MKKKSLSLLIVSFLLSICNHAQIWTQSQDTLLDGLSGLHRFIPFGNGYLTYNDQHLYLVTGLTQSWSEIEPNGIPPGQRNFTYVYGSTDSLFVISFPGNAYLSVDGGANWQPAVMNGFPSANLRDSLLSISEFGRYYLAAYGTPNHHYLSSDGLNWASYCSDCNRSGTDYLAVNLGPNGVEIRDTGLQAVDTIHYWSPVSANLSATTADGHDEYSISFQDSMIYRRNLVADSTPVTVVGPFVPIPELLSTPFVSYYIAGNLQLICAWYVSPTNSGALTYYLSSDGGVTWTSRTDLGWMFNAPPIRITGDTLLGPDILRHSYQYSTDAGQTWQPLHHHIKGMGYHLMCYSASLDTLLWSPSPLFAADDYPSGVMHSFDGGLTWSWCNTGLPTNIPSMLDSTLSIHGRIDGPFRIGGNYLLNYYDYNQLYSSTDGGNNWQLTNRPAVDFTIYCGTDDNEIFLDGIIYVTSGPVIEHFFRSGDLGVTWDTLNIPQGDTTGANSFGGIFIQGKHDTLICRYQQYIPIVSPVPLGHLLISADDGNSWTDITPGTMLNSRSRQIDVGNPFVSREALITCGNHANEFMTVVMTIDTFGMGDYFNPAAYHDSLYWFDGTNWTIIQHTGLPADIDIQSLTAGNGAWYIGSNYGPYVSYDNGVSWNGNAIRTNGPPAVLPLTNNGLPGTLAMYQMHTNGTELKTATRGNGIWQFNLITANPSASQSPENSLLAAWPSPAAAGEIISWQSPVDLNEATLSVTDASGRLVRVYHYNSIAAGATGQIETRDLPAGRYTISLLGNQQQFRGSFLVH